MTLKENGPVVYEEFMPANPILPKSLYPELKEPPSCPLKDIQFVRLEKFKRLQMHL